MGYGVCLFEDFILSFVPSVCGFEVCRAFCLLDVPDPVHGDCYLTPGLECMSSFPTLITRLLLALEIASVGRAPLILQTGFGLRWIFGCSK